MNTAQHCIMIALGAIFIFFYIAGIVHAVRHKRKIERLLNSYPKPKKVSKAVDYKLRLSKDQKV